MTGCTGSRRRSRRRSPSGGGTRCSPRRRGFPVSELTAVTYEEALQKYEPVFGLETHVELGTRTKMFCGCLTAFGAQPNTHVCPVCLGLPGSLPVLNRAAVDFAIRAALALGCTIHDT